MSYKFCKGHENLYQITIVLVNSSPGWACNAAETSRQSWGAVWLLASGFNVNTVSNLEKNHNQTNAQEIFRVDCDHRRLSYQLLDFQFARQKWYLSCRLDRYSRVDERWGARKGLYVHVLASRRFLTRTNASVVFNLVYQNMLDQKEWSSQARRSDGDKTSRTCPCTSCGGVNMCLAEQYLWTSVY